MFVRVSGPMRVKSSFDEFESTSIERMEAQFSVSDAEEISTAYRGRVREILEFGEFGERSENEHVTVSPVLPNNRPRMDWHIEVSGTIVKRLYQYACEMYNPEADDRSFRRSPYTVLSAWASSGRHKGRDSDCPSKAMEILSVGAMQLEDDSVLREPLDDDEWDDIIDAYHDFEL